MKKTVITTLFVAGVLMLSGCGSKVPQSFIDKHNETAALAKEAEKASDLTNMPEMKALEGQMSSNDYNGALKSIEAALGRKNDTAAKLNSIDSKLTELGALSSQISDVKIKASADKFIDISKKENSVKINYNNLQVQMLEKAKTMVNILIKNPKTISAADEKAVNDLAKQIDDLKNQITAAEKGVNDVQSQYKETEKEFFTLAGLEITK